MKIEKIEKKKKRGGYRPGAGSKPKHPSGRGVDVSFYLPPDLAEKVREYVAQLRAEAGIIPRPRTGGRIRADDVQAEKILTPPSPKL